MKTKNFTRKHLIIISLTLAGLFNPQKTLAKEDIQSKIDEYIRAYEEINWFSGAILVAKDGKVLFEKGYGKSDFENNIQNSPKTKFRICSLTKSFTAMAIMQLEGKGLLSLNDTLSKYITDYPAGDKITIYHLLTHTSGIVNHTELPSFLTDRRLKPCSVTHTISTFKNKPLDFEPGEKFEYSNSNYILLGLIIEKVSGVPYGDFIRDNIFEPLEMHNSGFEYHGQEIENFAKGYGLANGEITDADFRVMSNAHASGALYSTVEDLYRWDRALYTEKLIDKSKLNDMFKPHKGKYGYGWGVDEIFNKKVSAHGGDVEGFQTYITRFADDGVCIITLSNFEHVPIGKINIELAAILFGEKYELPRKVKKDNAIYEKYKDYVGQYKLNEKLTFHITQNGNHLFCQLTGQGKLELYPESETEFFFREVDATITFAKDEKGKVTKLTLQQSGHTVPAPKIK